MKIVTTRRFLKKIIFILFVLLFYFVFIDKPKANTILPALPFNDNYPHVISVYDFGQNTGVRYVYVTYCKNENYILRSRGNNVEYGYCYDSNGNNQGYAYRRGFSYNDSNITWQDIIDYNVDFSSYEWGAERYDYSYSTVLGWNNVDNRLSYYKDYQEELTPQGNLITLLTGNTSLYNSSGNTILFDKDLFNSTTIGIAWTYTTKNGYLDLELSATGFNYNAYDTYDIILENLNTGNKNYLLPNVTGIVTQNISVYEPTTYRYYIYDKVAQEVYYEEIITLNSVKYSNVGVNVSNIDKNNTSVTYNYYNYGNLNNLVCTHQIANGSEVTDNNCFTQDFTLNVGGNKSVTFRIYNGSDVIFKTSIPFIFDTTQPYVNFSEEYVGSITNIRVKLNNYSSSYQVKYTLNNGTEITPTLDENNTFIVYNLNESTTIQVYIYQNGNVIANSVYTYNPIKNEQVNISDYEGIKGFFNRLNISNINNDLKNYVQSFGTFVMSTKLGNLIIVMATITILGFIISLIRR